jgi:glycosyltransferase involved in cell wall biosynthesis
VTRTVELTLIMPAYNERKTIEEAIHQVLQADLGVSSIELLVVDDGSTDGTRELLRDRDWPDEVSVLMHDHNRGKGAAIVTALAHASGAYTAIIDADLEYDPQDIAQLLVPLVNGESVAVYGSRGFDSHSAYSFWYVVGNKLVTFTANLLYNSWVADIMTCHKVIRTDVFRSLRLRERGFAIEPEITARLLRKGIRIYEIPVSYRARSREDGKKLTPADGIRVLRTLLRCRIW